MFKKAISILIFTGLAFAQQKTTRVRSYTRKDGTPVNSYTRKVATGKRDHK